MRINQAHMELKEQSWIILVILSIAEGVAEINSNQNTTSYLIPCEDGWFLFGDKCYAVFGTSKGVTWSSAKENCADHNGSLVTIQSRELQDFLKTFLLLDMKSSAWIGLTYVGIYRKHFWADGSIFNYTNWGRGEPSGSFMPRPWDVYCIEMQYDYPAKHGKWNDLSCNAELPFMCQTNKSEQSRNHDPRFCTGENDGAWKYENSCYHTVSEEMSWDDAENYCQTVFKGHLLTILDDEVEIFLNYVLSDFSREFWIGIKIRDAVVKQMWSSGWIVSFKKWKTDDVPNMNGACAYMTEEKLWSSAPCFRKLPFVCEVLQVKPPALKQVPEGWRCPELSQDWVDLGGDTCYIFEYKERNNWVEANFACLKKGGFLATITSDAETNAIHRRLKGGSSTIWIGLHRSLSNNSVFEWADGTVLDYLNWQNGQPNSEKQLCGTIWVPDMKWIDDECKVHSHYICSAKKVPSFLQGNNESGVIDDPRLKETYCSGVALWKISLAVLGVVLIILWIVGFAIYIDKTHCRKNNDQCRKYFACHVQQEVEMKRELTQNDLDYIT